VRVVAENREMHGCLLAIALTENSG